MRTSLHRTAALAATALLASALAVPFASPAHAIVPDRVWTVADTDDDGGYGLSTLDLASPVEEHDNVEVTEVSASADGSRVIYVRFTPTSQQVLVRDTGTRYVRVLETIGLSETIYLTDPILSPDGNTAAWTIVSATSDGLALRLRVAPVGALVKPVTRRVGYRSLGFIDDSTLLMQTLGGWNQTGPLAGGATEPVSGLPRYAQSAALSPDSTKIAWSEDTSTSSTSTATVTAGKFTKIGDTWTVSHTHQLSSAQDNSQPAFSRDGVSVHWVRYDGNVGPGAVLKRVWDASEAASTVDASEDHVDVAVSTMPSADVTDPAAPTALPAVLRGPGATLRWAVTADDELSGVEITRSGANPVFVPYPRTSLDVQGLSMGTDYTFSLKAVDRSNRKSTADALTLTALKAVPATFPNPTSSGSTNATFPVRFGAGGPSSATWKVDYADKAVEGWKPWITGLHSAGTQAFGGAGGTGVNATTSVPGASYTFRTRVYDAHGNATPYVNSARGLVPFDQAAATLVGGSNIYTPLAYMGFVRKLYRTNHYARMNVTGKRFQLVGSTCGNCGVFDLFDNGKWLGSVDTYGPVTRLRQVLVTVDYPAVGSHSFVVKPRATPGRPNVYVDGFGMLKPS